MRSLYDEVLLEHNKHPLHKGVLDGDDIEAVEVANESCGDRLTLSFREKDGVIEDIKFTGTGCAVALAATDLMIDALIGRSWEEASELMAQYQQMVTGQLDEAQIKALGELGALSCVARMPARVSCAKLPWRLVELSERSR